MTLPVTNPALDLPTVYTRGMEPNAATDVFEDTLTGPNSYAASGSTTYVPTIVIFTPESDGTMQATATADIATASPISGALARLRVSSGSVDNANGAFSSDIRRVAFQVNNTMTTSVPMQIQLEIPNPSFNTSVRNVRLRVEAIKR